MNRNKVSLRWQSLEPLLGPNLSRHAPGARLRSDVLARFAEQTAKLAETYGVPFPQTMPQESAEPIAETGDGGYHRNYNKAERRR